MNKKYISRTLVSIISILANALSLAIVFESNVSNTTIGMSAENIGITLNITDGQALTIILVTCFILSRIISGSFRPLLDSAGFILALLFGYVVDLFDDIVSLIPHESYIASLVMLFLGLCLMTFTISAYIRANVILMPIDDFMATIRTAFFKGNITVASYFLNASFLAITGLCWWYNGYVESLNILTLIIFLIFSPMIGWFENNTKFIDKLV